MTDDHFEERESKLLEFKASPPKFDALIKTCIAFANGAGGRIIIGVEDSTRKVIGVSNHDRDRIYEDFPNSLYDSTQPSIIAQIYEQGFSSGLVLIIEVPASPRKPYFLKSKGMAQGTYIRVGSCTRKASPESIADLTREAQRISYDEEIIHASTDILSNELLHDFLGARVTKKRLLSEKIISQQPANHEKYHPTIAGVLMFSENPHGYIPEALIKCTEFKGTEGRDITRTEDIIGNIEQQASNSLHLITKWLERNYELHGAQLKGSMPIPKEAIREAILNALLHRKYNIPGAIKVAIYSDRLEIFSPGCFPGLVDINNLGDGTTYLRNPALVRLAYTQRLIETRGTGIKLIYDSCKKLGLKKPAYHEEGDFVKIIFYFSVDPSVFDNEIDAILSFIKSQTNVSAKQVSDFLNVSHNTAIRKLGALIKQRKLQKVGDGPATRYQLKP